MEPTTLPQTKAGIQRLVLATVQGKQLAGAAVSMGVGKTYIGLKDMNRILDYGRRVKPGQQQEKFFLVAAPTQSILDSWVSEAQKWNLEYLLDHVDFTTYLSLNKKLLKRRYHKLYLDECHSLKFSHHALLEAHRLEGKAILGLTGTPPVNRGSEKGRMVAQFCPILVDYTTDEAVLAGLLNDYRIVVHSVALSKTRDFVITYKNGKSKTTSEYNEYWHWSSRVAAAEAHEPGETIPLETLRILRMQALMKFTSKEKYLLQLAAQFPHEKVLLFTCNQDQARRVCPHSYISDNKDSKANLALFNSGEINRLSCVNQLSEGINIRDLRTIIIWHAFGNERKASQKIGRALRLNPAETATVHVLCYENTVDELWVEKALAKFDPQKIIRVSHDF